MADNRINEVSNVGTRGEGAGVDASQFQVGRFSMENALNNPTMNVGGGADDFPIVDLTDEQGRGGGGRASDNRREGAGGEALNEPNQEDNNRMHEQTHDGAQNDNRDHGNNGVAEADKKINDPLKKKPLGDKNQQGGEGSGNGSTAPAAPETTTDTGVGGTGTGGTPESTTFDRGIGQKPLPSSGSTELPPSIGGGVVPGGKPPINDKGTAGE